MKKIVLSSIKYFLIILDLMIAAANCQVYARQEKPHDIIISNKNIQLRISEDLQASVYSIDTGSKLPVCLIRPSQFIYYLTQDLAQQAKAKRPILFRIISTKVKSTFNASYGKCREYDLKTMASDKSSEIGLSILLPQRFPNAILCFTSIKNLSSNTIYINKLVASNFILDAKAFGADSSYKFWSFQGGSYPERYDWILPLSNSYYRENYQGMNAPDYGGGMPIVDFWTKREGIAFASLSMTPELISLPVRVMKNENVSFQIKDSTLHILKPGETIKTIPYAIILHSGDYYNALNTYSAVMQGQGLRYAKAPKDAFEPEWCAWGYERNFNKQQILESLDKVKSLGIKWVTIDDGWQNTDGDWQIDKVKFPKGEEEFKKLIKTIHSYGLKVRLWWVPFETHDSAHNATHYPGRMNEYGMKFQSNIALQHPEWFLLNSDQSRVQVSYWNSYLICPAYKQVIDHFIEFITKAIKEWGVDGFKIDGMNFNSVPLCYNESHHHKSPDEAPRAVPMFFREIYNTAVKLKPDIVLQLCPCGDNFSLYNLPYVNQTVASDPVSSWQVRSRAKTFKALFGSIVTYSGDHVELTSRKWDEKLQQYFTFRQEDFASTVGLGGVPATKFTATSVIQPDSSLMLTTEKESYWKKWLDIYEKEKISRGEYLNLYDIAFDKPETHLIKKDSVMYYSFFSDGSFSGKVELRGLEEGEYNIIDIQSNTTIARINSKSPFIDISFNYDLILKAIPSKK